MATHSSVLAWRIPGMGEPSGLPSTGSHRVRHDWRDLAAAAAWGSQGKNTEEACRSLLQWAKFCQTSPPWPACLGWPHMAWLSFIELDKAVVRVIRLTSFLWLWFVCLPSDASLNTYRLTWVSLTLDMGCLFTAAPAKRSHCSLPWTRGISSGSPLQTLNVE